MALRRTRKKRSGASAGQTDSLTDVFEEAIKHHRILRAVDVLVGAEHIVVVTLDDARSHCPAEYFGGIKADSNTILPAVNIFAGNMLHLGPIFSYGIAVGKSRLYQPSP